MTDQLDLFRKSDAQKPARKFFHVGAEQEHFTLDQFKATQTYRELAITAEEESLLRVAVFEGITTVDDWVVILKALREKRFVFHIKLMKDSLSWHFNLKKSISYSFGKMIRGISER